MHQDEAVKITLDDYNRMKEVSAALGPEPIFEASPLVGLSPLGSRITGAILGAAIGDALGHPTEFRKTRQAIEEAFGVGGVRGFVLYWDRDGKHFAPYTDDTQLAWTVLVSLIESVRGGWSLDRTMERIAQRFVCWAYEPTGGHRAPGNATLAGCRRLLHGSSWREAGDAKAGGCGSVMRAYPFGLLFCGDPDRAEHWAAEHSYPTHQASIALAASAGMARGMAVATTGSPSETVLTEMIAAAGRFDRTTATLLGNAVAAASSNRSTEEVLDGLPGWAAHEALAAGAFLYARYPENFSAAVLAGANAPGDSDSIATLAGALVGSSVGLSGIPEGWVTDVEDSQRLAGAATEVTSLVSAAPGD